MPAVNTVSPRSSILPASTSPQSHSTMSTTMSTTGGQVDKSGSPGTGVPSSGTNGDSNAIQDSQEKGSPESQNDATSPNRRDQNVRGGNLSPTQMGNSYPPAYPAHLTPQQQGYYVAYNSQVTPEPPSPAGPGGAVYDVGSFFHQPGAFHSNNPFPGTQQFLNPNQQLQQAPPSPSQSNSVPPASPLFPRVTGQATAGLLDQNRILDGTIQPRGAPLSPGPPYLSPALGPSVANTAGWGDSRNPQSAYQHNSPQISAQGIPIPYVPGMPPRSGSAGGRSISFEETMLPPSAVQDQQNQQQPPQDQNPGYNPYGGTNQNNLVGAGGAAGAATLFNQHWGYGGPPIGGPPDMYNAPGSPLQPRPTPPMGPYPGVGGGPPRHHPHAPHMGPYGGQYYPATSPGPPIQTTASNKGPDGANLFIFHIPNHFTNLDMYQLFCPYGNLLSVRIMVEKDTGRSRGFGFVSYDSPDAAALAIKELNGFPIGNKRLKVQHKQIRPSDQHHDRNHHSNNNHGGYDIGGGGYGGRGQMTPSLPPSGPMAAMSHSSWYNNSRAQAQHHAGGLPEAVDGGVPPQPQEPLQQGLSQEDGEALGGGNSTANAVGTADGVNDPSKSPLPSPLATMDRLGQALPDVGGSGD